MVHLFLCLALVCHAAQAQRCPLSTSELAHGSVFLTHLDSPARQGKLVNCTWYSESTCCTPEDTLRISHEPSEINLHGSPMRCLDAMRLLACSPCSSVWCRYTRVSSIVTVSIAHKKYLEISSTINNCI